MTENPMDLHYAQILTKHHFYRGRKSHAQTNSFGLTFIVLFTHDRNIDKF